MELFKRMRFLFRPSNAWKMAYDKGYVQGLEEGSDFGKRIAYNQVLSKEISGILSRYSQLQVKMLDKPKSEMQKAFAEFHQQEIDRFKMEIQDR